MKLSSYSNKCSLSRGVRPEDTFHCRKRHKTSTSIKRTPLNMEICMSPPFGVSNKEVSLKRTVDSRTRTTTRTRLNLKFFFFNEL